MNSKNPGTYNHLFRYIIVGDMGKIINLKFSLIQPLENPAYYCNLLNVNLDISMN